MKFDRLKRLILSSFTIAVSSSSQILNSDPVLFFVFFGLLEFAPTDVEEVDLEILLLTDFDLGLLPSTF